MGALTFGSCSCRRPPGASVPPGFDGWGLASPLGLFTAEFIYDYSTISQEPAANIGGWSIHSIAPPFLNRFLASPLQSVPLWGISGRYELTSFVGPERAGTSGGMSVRVRATGNAGGSVLVVFKAGSGFGDRQLAIQTPTDPYESDHNFSVGVGGWGVFVPVGPGWRTNAKVGVRVSWIV